ncbi:siderophore biosynthesis protein [Corynebacterium diphtheriae]|nr:siderophore biosynthesis protein [Corynebacterium diphtheriae]CAB0956230.1 siderophore biosynthesis protein [Corynebacterium diphtheriae]
MLENGYISQSNCESDIRGRLLAALIDEHLITPETHHKLTNTTTPPAELLRQLAQDNQLTITPTNLERACAEIADSVVGLHRARTAITQRWEQALNAQTATNTSQTPYSDLIQALRQRCRLEDRGSSAMLARCEQLVCDGHPAHPAAKTSLGIGDSFLHVLPEQTETIQLRFVAVDTDHAVVVGGHPVETINEAMPLLGARLNAELERRELHHHSVIPVHPFQWDNVITSEFAEEIASGTIVLLETTATAEPLMSVRTLRVSDTTGSMHIKVALEIQLTGAVRGVSAGAVAAPAIASIIDDACTLDAGFIPRTDTDQPAFSVAYDRSAIRWNADSGIRAHCFGAVLRDDPTGNADDEIAMPVATLLARNPLTGATIAADLIDELSHRHNRHRDEIATDWFTALGKLLFVPAVALIARWGIALEPHPQNTIIILRDGMPHRIVVRDLGGCRLWANGPLAAHPIVDKLRATALIENDLIRLIDKVFYPLVANLHRNLITAAAITKPAQQRINLALSTHIAREYWRTTASHLHPADTVATVFQRILGPVLPVKRVLGMRLSGAVTEQEYVADINPLENLELLTPESLRAACAPYSEWAHETLATRLHDAAVRERIDDSFPTLRDDIANAEENLALVRAQVTSRVNTPESYWDLLKGLPPHAAMIAADSYAISGHNVHPLAKLRRGFSIEESAAYGPEAGMSTDLRLVGVDKRMIDTSTTADCVQLIAHHFPRHIAYARTHLHEHGLDADSYAIIPVHPWQLEHVIREAFAKDIADHTMVPIPNIAIAAHPTISLRTLVPHAPTPSGTRPFIKCAVDVTLTSTRRSISQDSALGTPRVAGLVATALEQLRKETNVQPRAVVVPELSGLSLSRDERSEGIDDSFRKTRQRGLSVLLRDDATAYLAPGEIAMSACALRGHEGVVPSPLRDINEEFFDDYVYDLMSTVLGLMMVKGIALEQHLQNTLVRIDLSGKTPVYRGIMLRDFSGLRAWTPRLQQWASDQVFEPGAITLTDDHEEFVNKGFYASVFGNLDGIVDEYSQARGVDAQSLWERVHVQINRFVQEAAGMLPAVDMEWMRRETIRRKGFVSMSLQGSSADIYVEERNPLAANPAWA